MKSGTEQFFRLVDDAYRGRLQLPAFQRPWGWTGQQVVSLFDSIRKDYPIGSFLFLDARPDFDLSPRGFSGGQPTTPDALERYVLDGQQRINAGIAIYYGANQAGAFNYYLDLERLWQDHLRCTLDLLDSQAVSAFASDHDDDDEYCVARKISSDPCQLLLNKHLLWTPFLTDDATFQTAIDPYLTSYADRKRFIDYLIRPHFKLAAAVSVAVITLDKKETIEATTKIFATLNTTGKPLTPFEIVVARLYSSGIVLPQDVEDNQEASSYYKNMDPTGEIFLQTIAMLAKQTPKKAKLPKTITGERYKQYAPVAVEILERLGELLTKRLGLGLDVTSTLVPYETIFPPMALCLYGIEQANLKGTHLSIAQTKLEKWFVKAALSGRYQEGVNTKQESDAEDMLQWILTPDLEEPTWMRNFQLPRLLDASPSGAIGRLLACLMNRETPKDPITKNTVGYHPNASSATERHHIFPKMFCLDHIPDWLTTENANQALNIIFAESETNKRWTKLNPAAQLTDIQKALPDAHVRDTILAKHYLDPTCIAILAKPDKTLQDYRDFLEAREQTFIKRFAEWEIYPTNSAAVGANNV